MPRSGRTTERFSWTGVVQAIQPWIEMTRSYNKRQCSYIGYALRLDATWKGRSGLLLVRVGKAAHLKHQFHAGLQLNGSSVGYRDIGLESPVLYKTTGIRVLDSCAAARPGGPPFVGVPPNLAVYHERGYRRLDDSAYWRRCEDCMWASRMPVTLIVDDWNPIYREYRAETFCFGPKACPFYQAGEIRTAPGRNGKVYEEFNWVDEDATSHRGPDD